MSRFADLVPTLRMLMAPLLTSLLRGVRRMVHLVGVLVVLMVVLAFTRVPYDAHQWLGTEGGLLHDRPTVIMVLGGSGMPSGPELLRLHYAAELGRAFPEASIWLVHVDDSTSTRLMEGELLLRGVGGTRIERSMFGNNTREQALHLARSRPQLKQEKIALITAPENMYRSLRTLRKLGFANVQGVPAFDRPLFVDMDYSLRLIGGSWLAPDVSENIDLRYTFWNYLKLEVTCSREFVAIAYYSLNGWI